MPADQVRSTAADAAPRRSYQRFDDLRMAAQTQIIVAAKAQQFPAVDPQPGAHQRFGDPSPSIEMVMDDPVQRRSKDIPSVHDLAREVRLGRTALSASAAAANSTVRWGPATVIRRSRTFWSVRGRDSVWAPVFG